MQNTCDYIRKKTVFNFFLWGVGIMRKSFYLFAAMIMAVPCAAQAQVDDFYGNLMISDEVKVDDESTIAKDKAKGLLNKKIKPVEIEARKLPKRTRQAITQKKEEAVKEYDFAPFGVLWGAGVQATKDLGVTLEQHDAKGYDNMFSATKLPKPVNDFQTVYLVFGKENELSRIISYSNFSDDDDSLSKGLFLYNKYYKLLDSKYGNAKQVFTPKISKIEKTIDLGNNKTKIETELKEEPIGNTDFKNQIAKGEARLLATFEDKDTGVVLTLRVNEEGQSYIIIDYKSLMVIKAREKKILDAL